MNRIIKVELALQPDGRWLVSVTKEFAPEHGGGSQVFEQLCGRELHYALDAARGMVTVSAGQRTDLAGVAE